MQIILLQPVSFTNTVLHPALGHVRTYQSTQTLSTVTKAMLENARLARHCGKIINLERSGRTMCTTIRTLTFAAVMASSMTVRALVSFFFST